MTMCEAIQEALAACGLVHSEISFKHSSRSFVSAKGCKGKITKAWLTWSYLVHFPSLVNRKSTILKARNTLEAQHRTLDDGWCIFAQIYTEPWVLQPPRYYHPSYISNYSILTYSKYLWILVIQNRCLFHLVSRFTPSSGFSSRQHRLRFYLISFRWGQSLLPGRVACG